MDAFRGAPTMVSSPVRTTPPPSNTEMVAAMLWALSLGWWSTRVDHGQVLLFHAAVWIPLVILLWPVRRSGVELAWRLMAAGVVMFALGDAAWDVITATGAQPDASWADSVYLAGYAVLAAGVVVLLRNHGGPNRRDGLLDGLLVALPTAVLITEFLILPGDDATKELAVRIVNGAYPLVDAVLVAAVVWLLVTPGLARRVVVPLATGLATTLALDIVWAAGSLAGADSVTAVVNGFYPVTYVVIACGIALGAAMPVGQPQPDGHMSVPWGRVTLLAAGLVAAPLTAVLSITFHRDFQPVVIVTATVAAAALVVLRFVSLINDLNRTNADLAAARNEIRDQAVRDPLTGVYNRLILPDQLAVLTSGTGPPAALLSIDLDHFKEVNDRHGHHAGDIVLEAVASRLRLRTRPSDAIIRMGGDEFLVILWNVDAVEATRLASRIVLTIEEPISFGPATLRVSASVGIAVVGTGPTTDADTDRLLHQADTAMYEAKRSGERVHLTVT
jgi:diguanylate cyclase (GGDEF)-like protein